VRQVKGALKDKRTGEFAFKTIFPGEEGKGERERERGADSIAKKSLFAASEGCAKICIPIDEL
jgi:hypothetical protein